MKENRSTSIDSAKNLEHSGKLFGIEAKIINVSVGPLLPDMSFSPGRGQSKSYCKPYR